MLTERWMPWAVTGGLLLSASLVCGAAWYASSTETKPVQTAANPKATLSSRCGCRIESVQVRRHGPRMVPPARTPDGAPGPFTPDATCVLLVHSETPIGRARVSMIADADSCGRIVATERFEFRRGHNVVSLACHSMTEPAKVVIETQTGIVSAPVSLPSAEELRTAAN